MEPSADSTILNRATVRVDFPAPVLPTIPTFFPPSTLQVILYNKIKTFPISQTIIFKFNLSILRPVSSRSICWINPRCFLFNFTVLHDSLNTNNIGFHICSHSDQPVQGHRDVQRVGNDKPNLTGVDTSWA